MRGASLFALALALATPAFGQDPGRALYDKYCSQCHGDQGDGRGPAADRVKPAPRDFTSGKYKVRSTPSGSVPTDADLARVIRRGLPYTAMPAFPDFSDAEVRQLVEVVKSFSKDFENPAKHLDAIPLPKAPAFDDALVARGKEIYAQTGCARCHGEEGRGDGASAPTLVDDWGHHIRPADLQKPWTFRGGGTAEDIYRTMSTGFFGTPMPGFLGSLDPADVWAIVAYMRSLSGNAEEAPYGKVLRAVESPEPIDVARGRELFANAPETLFPVFGQIVEPGRAFYASANAIAARAVVDSEKIAILLTWHDMRAETSGRNGPALEVPAWDAQLAESRLEEAAKPAGGAADPFADPFADAGGGASGPPFKPGSDVEFSDAVAIQLPQKKPSGIVRPYFLLGDAQNPVDLWFVDLAQTRATRWVGRGSAALAPSDALPPAVAHGYAHGEWWTVFVIDRRNRDGVAFDDDTFVPIAFSLWDGFDRERGNKRGLTAWYNLYVEPSDRPSPYPAMAKAALGVLLVELLLIAWVRRTRRTGAEPAAEPSEATA